MSPQTDDEHLALVARCMVTGTVVPFLGAGANLCGRPDETFETPWVKGEYLPSGKELALELMSKVTYPDQADRDLMRISQYVASTAGSTDLYRWIRDPLNAAYQPTALHQFLAALSQGLRKREKPPQVILTTNYDDALERAFDAIEEPYDLIWYEAKGSDCGRFIHQRSTLGAEPEGQDDGGETRPEVIERANEYAEIDPDTCTVIVKLHGAMFPEDHERDSYVITEDDYIRYLTGVDIASQLPAVVRARIKESHLLFLGYSMRDWNLRVVLERLGGSEVLSNTDWSVQREPDAPGSKQIEETLWGKRNVDLRFILLHEYVAGLTQAVRTAMAEEDARIAEERARELARSKPAPVQPPPPVF